MNYEEMKENLLSQVKKDGNHLEPIATYCIENLINNPENREKLMQKPLKQCWGHITSEARKVAVNNAAMIESNEVFGWVREFYGISDLTVVKQPEAEKSKTVSIFDFM